MHSPDTLGTATETVTLPFLVPFKGVDNANWHTFDELSLCAADRFSYKCLILSAQDYPTPVDVLPRISYFGAVPAEGRR